MQTQAESISSLQQDNIKDGVNQLVLNNPISYLKYIKTTSEINGVER